MRHADKEERGFVLVSVVVLLAILTVLGAVAMFKSSVQISVSASAVQGEQAFAAANAGLVENFAYWSFDTAAGQGEMDDVANDVAYGTSISPLLFWQDAAADHDFPTPTTMADLGASTAAIDTFIQSDVAAEGVRVFNVTATAMVETARANWGTGTDPQVAVWATSFENQDVSVYPFSTPNTHACWDCNVVVYALGRSGNARRMLREIQVVLDEQLESVSALTNAPTYGNWQETCDEATSKANLGSTSGWMATLQNTVIEVTQAPYVRNISDAGSRPSGVALKSNTKLGGGGRQFRNAKGSTTGATFERTPLIAYAGHGATAAANEARGNPAGAGQDNTVTYDNLDLLLTDELPHNLISAPTMNTAEEMKYFENANDQLFDLDAYRWGAEEFTCQDPSKADGTAGNGRYCSKAEALRNAMIAMGIPAQAPVTGRLTVAEFQYNANYGIPMFGLVRVMLPTKPGGGSAAFSCTLDGAAFNGEIHDIAAIIQNMKTDPAGGTGFYTGSPTVVDPDGILDGTARLIVYGSLFFDFFRDVGDPSVTNPPKGVKKDPFEDNNVFDPAAGERLLLPLEATDVYTRIEFPILINPVMQRGTLGSFPTAAAGGVIATGVSTNPVNLAAPTGGFFPAHAGLLQMTDSDTYRKGLAGTMKLMSNGVSYPSINMPADGLVSISEAMAASPGVFPPAGAEPMYAANKAEIEYYYELMKKVAKQSDQFAWPIAAFPTSLNDSFYIGVEDQAAGHNDGDTLHLLFPSGYTHGWKVALAALNVTAWDWNNLLANLDAGLAAQHATHRNYGDAAMPKGSPFNVAQDSGYGEAARLVLNQSRYFYVDATHSSGYGLLTEEWRDIPAEMYVGGLLDMHSHGNINGLVYTPGPLEWEPGVAKFGGNQDDLSYINGAIVTGFGAYVRNAVPDSRFVLVYSNESSDNINTRKVLYDPRRSAWQELS